MAGLELFPENEPTAPTPSQVDQKASDFDFAAGPASQGVEYYQQMLNQKAEGMLRERFATSQETDLANARRDIYSQYMKDHVGPVTQDEADFLLHLSSTDLKMDRSTIFEQAFARRAINHLLPDSSENAPISPLAKSLSEAPDDTHDVLDRSQSLVTKLKGFQSLKQKYNDESNQAGFFGSAIDFAKGLIPLYSTIDTYRSLPSLPGGNPLLQGNALKEFGSYFWSSDVSPEEALAKANASYNNLESYSDKAAFIAAIDGLSQSDQDLFNLISVGDVATVGSLVGEVGKFALAGAKAGAKEELTHQLSNISKAIADPNATVASVADAAGKQEVAAIADVTQINAANAAAKTPLEETKAAFNELNNGLVQGPFRALTSPRLSTGASSWLKTHLDAVTDVLNGTLTKLNTVARLTPEEQSLAEREAVRNWQDLHPKMSQSILGWEFVAPETNVTNTGHAVVSIGTKNGIGFATEAQAKFTANAYGLKPGSYTIPSASHGNWAIKIETPVTEANSPLIHVPIPVDQRPVEGFINSMLGWFRPADVHVPSGHIGERNTFATVLSAMQNAVKQVSRTVEKGGKDVVRLLEMHSEKPYINAKGVLARGKYADTEQELENEWRQAFNRYPNDKEKAGYFTALKFHEFNHYMQNTQFYRDLTRAGIKQVGIKTPKGFSDPFLGKLVKELPDYGGYNVLIVEPSGSKAVVETYGSLKNRPDWKVLEQSIQNQKLQITQQFDREHKLLRNELKSITQVKGSLDSPIDFVISKGVSEEPLRGQLIPFEPLQAAENTRGFVSQPIVRTIGRTGKFRLDGVRKVLGFGTEAQAEKYAPLVERARLLLNDPSFDSFVTKELGFWTPAQWRAKFASKELDASIPIGHTLPGEDITKTGGFERRTGWDRSNIVNLDRSPHDLTIQVNPNLLEKYRGQYTSSTNTIRENGPAYTIDPTDRIDLMKSLYLDTQQSLRSRMAEDYKIKAQETFVSLFGSVLKASPEALRRNPGYYLSQAIENKNAWVDQTSSNFYKIKAAKNYALAVKYLLGMPTAATQDINWLQSKLLNSVYNYGGTVWSDRVNSYLLPMIKDPLVYVRAVSFHPVLGMFNPWQLFQQGQTMFSAAAIAGPKLAAKGVPAGFLLRRILINPSPGIIDHMAQIATNFGWTKAHFKEMFEALDRSGFAHVGAETFWKDDISPRIFSRMWQDKFVDWSTFFFNEGNRAPRLAGWAMAYKEWREANPLMTLNRQAEHDILARANLLNINQTRDSMSRLQKGIFSIPFYYHGYASKLMDLMLGKRLTVGEKARLFGMNSILYGIPIGVAGSVGVPLYDFVKSKILKNGGDPQGDVVTEAFVNGMAETLLHAITGKASNLPSVYGSDGLNIVSNSLSGDKTMLEIALGAPGSIITNIWNNAVPTYAALTAPLRGDRFDPSVLLTTMNGMASSISTWNKAQKAWAMYNYHQYNSKRGDYVAGTDTTDAALEALLGVSPMEVGDTYLKLGIMKDDRTYKDNIGKYIIDAYHNAFKAVDDEEHFKTEMRKIEVLVHFGNLTQQDKIKYYQQAIAGGYMEQAEKINQRFITWLNTPGAP